jgi:hypothetical protein
MNAPPPPPHPQPPPLTVSRPKRSRKRAIVIGGLIAVVGAIVLWSAAKGMYHNYRLSSAAVEKFHHELDQGDYDAIWEDSTDAFRAAGTRADTVKLFETVHQKMGASGKASSAGFHVNWQPGRANVNHVFDTAFSNGRAQEAFIWIVEQDHPRLQSYRIDSPLLH